VTVGVAVVVKLAALAGAVTISKPAITISSDHPSLLSISAPPQRGFIDDLEVSRGPQSSSGPAGAQRPSRVHCPGGSPARRATGSYDWEAHGDTADAADHIVLRLSRASAHFGALA
jgi:hypothetical protein